MKLLIIFSMVFTVLVAVFVLVTYNQMDQQVSLRPYEDVQLLPADGAVTVGAETPVGNMGDATSLVNPFEMSAENIASGKLAYRRYCWACHGPQLNGESTVGPSLPAMMTDLRSEDVAELSDGDLFWIIGHRLDVHPPIGTSMTPRERWETIIYLRKKQAEYEEY